MGCILLPYVLPVMVRLQPWWCYSHIVPLPLCTVHGVQLVIVPVIIPLQVASQGCLAVSKASGMGSLLYFLGIFFITHLCSFNSWQTFLRPTLIVPFSLLLMEGAAPCGCSQASH